MFYSSGGKPGVQPTFAATPREIFYSGREMAEFWESPTTIDGNLSSNPTNAPYQFLLFAGTVMGRVTTTGAGANGGQATTSGKLANSILGLSNAALGGGQTTLSTDVNTATELVRRIGTSGSLNLTGPPTAGGVVRTIKLTYSAVSLTTGAITITADAIGTGSGTNAVYPLAVVDSTGTGTFTITVEGITTAAITYNATVATLITNINAQLDAAFGTSAIVASGASLAALILTFSGTGYTHRPIASVSFNPVTAASFTVNGSALVDGTPLPVTATTAGVLPVTADEGEFVSGSLIQPTDGSQTALTVICDLYGCKCADGTNVTRVDAFDPQLLRKGGCLLDSALINWPSDASTRAYLKAALRVAIAGVNFLSDITG